MDVFPEAKRREIMARVRNRNTRQEVLVRSLLHRLGFRFRLHRSDVPGTPDILLPKYRVAIYVHGCFWHGHDCPRGRLPATNREFWKTKIEKNRERDRQIQAEALAEGWRPLTVWGCETSSRARLSALADRLEGELVDPGAPPREGEMQEGSQGHGPQYRSLGEKNYDEFADRYAEAVAEKPHNAHYNIPAVKSLLPDLAGRDVLDAGCGPGYLTKYLVDAGARVVAVDVTSRMVEITRERLGDTARVLRHDLAKPLEFAGDESFDLVVCPLVLSYIQDWRPVFREFYRVLRPGGIVVTSTEHPQGEYLWLRDTKKRDPHYFATELHAVPWTGFGEPEPVIAAYRRPLAEMINPILESGLLLDYVLEPKPTSEFKKLAPESYERLMQAPVFLCLRSRKPLRL